MPIEVVAILTPTEGNGEQVAALLAAHGEHVEKSEPGTLRYRIFKQAKSADIVVLETYIDKAALTAHGKSEKFKIMGKKLQDEGLLSKPIQIMILQDFGGFASRL